MSWTTCKHAECPKSQECLRFTEPEGTIIDYKNICSDKLKKPYEWFWQKEQSIVPTEEKLET